MSTITKEQLRERAREKVMGLEYALKHPGAFAETLTELEEELELARIALASLEAEPVAEVCEGFTLRYIGHGPAPKSGVRIGDRLYADPPALVANIHPLLEFAREYIESWDLDMAGDSSLLASAKKAIADSSAHQPAPVSVPDDVMAAMQKVARIRLDLNDFDGDKRGILDCLGDAEEALIEVVNRRAAMLQGAEPVTTDYKLPDDFDFDRFNDVTWLEAVASNPHMHSPTTSTIAMVALELNKRLEAGNSPVIPDGWKLVPNEPTTKQWAAGMQAFEYGMDKVTRVYKAMIAASPKWEVNQ